MVCRLSDGVDRLVEVNSVDMRNDIFDYDIYDRNGSRVGSITNIWKDEGTDTPEFAAVKTGWLFGREHVVPIRDAQVDPDERVVRVPYDEQQIKDAPDMAPDADLDPAEEERIYSHYRLDQQRGGLQGREGLPPAPGAPETREAAGEKRGGLFGRKKGVEGSTEAEIPLHEERVDVGKRKVETGGVRLRKVVRTETIHQPVEVEREHVEIERVPPEEMQDARARGGRPYEDEEILLSESREEPVIEKRDEITGGVRAHKETQTETENVRSEIRREDVEVDRDEGERHR